MKIEMVKCFLAPALWFICGISIATYKENPSYWEARRDGVGMLGLFIFTIFVTYWSYQ